MLALSCFQNLDKTMNSQLKALSPHRTLLSEICLLKAKPSGRLSVMAFSFKKKRDIFKQYISDTNRLSFFGLNVCEALSSLSTYFSQLSKNICHSYIAQHVDILEKCIDKCWQYNIQLPWKYVEKAFQTGRRQEAPVLIIKIGPLE